MNKPRIAIVTSFPRHQRVEVYNEMAKNNEINFCVFYLRKLPYGRDWKYGPKIEHNAIFIPEQRIYKHLYLSPGFLEKFIKYKPDLTIVTQYSSPVMQILMYLESIRKRPWIFWSEIPYVRYAENPIIYNKFFRNIFRNIALFPIAHFSMEIWGIGSRAVKEYRRIAKSNIIVRNLPYFANLNHFYYAKRCRKSSSCVRFLFSGSLTIRKGADILADAVKLLAKRNVNFEIHIAGKGPLEKKFRQLSDSESKHVFLYGFLQLDDVYKIYRKADILLFPSRHDGWGMTLVEGMAAGMPVISTCYTGAAIDMIRNSYNGFVLSKLTAEELAEAMYKFIKEPALINTMGKRAYETSKLYTYKVGARMFIDLIRCAITKYVHI